MDPLMLAALIVCWEPSFIHAPTRPYLPLLLGGSLTTYLVHLFEHGSSTGARVLLGFLSFFVIRNPRKQMHSTVTRIQYNSEFSRQFRVVA